MGWGAPPGRRWRRPGRRARRRRRRRRRTRPRGPRPWVQGAALRRARTRGPPSRGQRRAPAREGGWESGGVAGALRCGRGGRAHRDLRRRVAAGGGGAPSGARRPRCCCPRPRRRRRRASARRRGPRGASGGRRGPRRARRGCARPPWRAARGRRQQKRGAGSTSAPGVVRAVSQSGGGVDRLYSALGKEEGPVQCSLPGDEACWPARGAGLTAAIPDRAPAWASSSEDDSSAAEASSTGVTGACGAPGGAAAATATSFTCGGRPAARGLAQRFAATARRRRARRCALGRAAGR